MPEKQNLRFVNMLAVSNEEFYISNANSCASEAKKLALAGKEFLAGWFAARAAQYFNDFNSLKN